MERRYERRGERKKKLEFMQKMCMASWALMALTISADITLA